MVELPPVTSNVPWLVMLRSEGLLRFVSDTSPVLVRFQIFTVPVVAVMCPAFWMVSRLMLSVALCVTRDPRLRKLPPIPISCGETIVTPVPIVTFDEVAQLKVIDDDCVNDCVGG